MGSARAPFRVAAGTVVVLLVLFGSYHGLDKRGWIPHHHDTPVFIAGDWMVGELRTCEMQIMVGEEGMHDYLLDCAGGQGKPHLLPAKYWGRLDRDDVGRRESQQRFGTWRCQRKEDSLVCKAMD